MIQVSYSGEFKKDAKNRCDWYVKRTETKKVQMLFVRAFRKEPS